MLYIAVGKTKSSPITVSKLKAGAKTKKSNINVRKYVKKDSEFEDSALVSNLATLTNYKQHIKAQSKL